MDLSAVFSDPDKDPLTFSAESSDTTRVTVAVDGSELTFNAVAAGTPTVTVTADDGNGGTVSTTFTVTVYGLPNDPPTVVKEIEDLTLSAGETRDVDVSLVFNDPDKDPLTYTASSDNTSKATVSLSGSTVSVTAVAAGTSTVTVTAADDKAGTVDDKFVVTVEADVAPSFGSETVPAQTYIKGVAIATLTLPEATGGNRALTYAINPALPKGLVFSASSREITGTPDAETVAATYSYMVTDADGDAATLTFTIEVEADVAPSFGTVTVPAQTYTQGEEITALQLPAATGGNGALTYTLDPGAAGGSGVRCGQPAGHGDADGGGGADFLQLRGDGRGRRRGRAAGRDRGGGAAKQPTDSEESNPDQELNEGKSGTVDLSAVFSDPDNDTLTFSAESSNTAQVTVAVDGSTLTFNAVASGTRR